MRTGLAVLATALALVVHLGTQPANSGYTARITTPAAAVTMKHTKGAGKIVSGKSPALCVDNDAGSAANGNKIQVWQCLSGWSAQEWTLPGDGSLRVQGKCLDVRGGKTDEGTPIQLYDCNDTGAQIWQPRANGQLWNPRSDKCLTYGGVTGQHLLLVSCGGLGTNQKWILP